MVIKIYLGKLLESSLMEGARKSSCFYIKII